ncbi:MAG: hypothetical protein OXE94_06850 [Aestuariivita sp.]|nr:hypothetical protein [Aestuariivita sp.]MCY4203254.1 hypothetical protein [Aestuariivita sp.]MCY4287121.1 hypothetical protein [Aestuariivita sp.]
MTDLVKSRYYIETKPIETVRDPHRVNTIMNTLGFRVVDSFTGMPIGCVLHSSENDRSFQAFMYLGSGNGEIKPPENGWGRRYDHAALEVWKGYSTSLPFCERWYRWAWRWMGVGWFLFGTTWGVLTSFIVQALSM